METTDNEALQEQLEEAQVNAAFQAMLDTYLASPHRKKVDIITRAFTFAKQAHKGVRRHSGEPYIMHPIAVARIVSEEIGLGSTSICAALLHDVVEDTEYTVDDIRNLFGDKIAQIVDGLTKIAGGIFGDQASAQTENFKKLLLTMSEDIRVILIKIADRLHNMRTLSSMPAYKQYKIAGETLYIYAPIAYRLGLGKIKAELENLSFHYEHPEEYARIEAKLAATQATRDILFREFTDPIRQQLDAMGLRYEIRGRVKSPYSIWKKMQSKNLTFEEIYDILAVRIVFDTDSPALEANQCFDIYIALTKLYRSHPDRLRDWVSQPKTNGYQALHVTLMSHQGNWVEVQIRSRRMDDIAEQGVAAHWKYKAQPAISPTPAGGEAEADDGELDKWLHTIREILDDPQPDAMDFLGAIKLNLYSSEIFVFTPKGDIRTMPQGSTALDFAFVIHTMVGTHCIGAKVNHKLVPLTYQLCSGDQVEILTSQNQHVAPEWLDTVTTAKARSKIQAALRRQARAAQKDGEALLAAFFEKADITPTSEDIDKLCRLHSVATRDELLSAIGSGSITLGDAEKNALRAPAGLGSLFHRRKALPAAAPTAEGQDKVADSLPGGKNRKQAILLTDELIRTRFHMCTICNPIAGDAVLGYVEPDGHITIHKRSCPEAAKLKAGHGNRLVAATWNTGKAIFFSATIGIKGIDTLGMLNRITHIISQQLNVNMEKIVIEAKDGIFDGTIRLRVHDVGDINAILADLRKLTEISSAVRLK